jgi:predicted RNase H-like nuclease (RuvC/YqgF family)
MLDSTVVVAIIVTVGGWVFYILQKFVDKRYNRAKEVVQKNSATVVDMVNVVDGLKGLLEEYRNRNKELENEVSGLKQEVDQLKGGTE